MRRAVLSLVCAVLVAALPAPAFAAAPNGQLAAVTDGRLVTVNTDGTGLRTLWTPTGVITGLSWSPDGNRLAFSLDGRITIFDVFADRVTPLINPAEGTRDVNPAWSPNGARIGFRRVGPLVQQSFTMALDGTGVRTETLDPLTSAFAWDPQLNTSAWVIGSLLFVTQFDLFSLHSDVSGTPAWSPDSQKVAFVHASGLLVKPITQGAADTFVTPPPVASPRWAPAGDQLLYVTGEQVRTVDALGGTAATVPGLANVTAADWQPCALTAVACRSFSPPHCSATTGQVTTQTGQPVDLPPAPCADPASQPLSHVFVKQPDHGLLAGTRYTPNPGFTGQDSVHYRVSNGTGESEVVKVTIFVVPRPPAASPPPVARPADATQAPFLSLQVKPRLERTRSALARLSCDQACTFQVRLTARVKGRKQAVNGTRVKRSLVAGRVLAIRLRLPKKPKGSVKTVWIIGTVSNAAGQTRPVKLPVSVPR